MRVPAPVLALLIAFALAMGWFVDRATAFHDPRGQAPAWGAAHWLGGDAGSGKLYLRRTVDIASAPADAWLQVAGTDHFEVFVNGTAVGRHDALAERPSAAYDVTRLLRPGRNLIALDVTAASRASAPQAIARLDWREGGAARQLASDAAWRASARHVARPAGLAQWNEPAFDDTDWPAARARAAGAAERTPPQGLPMALLASLAPREWIWSGPPNVGVAAFGRELHVDAAAIREAWLGVAVGGVYTVAVNGRVVAPALGADTRTDVLDIAPYLHPGTNRVEVQVGGAAEPARLAIVGRVLGDALDLDFSSDGRWHGATPADLVVNFGRVGDRPPALALRTVPPSPAWARHLLGRWLGWSALAFALALAATAWLARRRTWTRAALPCLGATWLLLLALLADLDPRFVLEGRHAFAPAVAAAVLAALVAVWPARRSEAVR